MDVFTILIGVATLGLLWWARSLSERLGVVETSRRLMDIDLAQVRIELAQLKFLSDASLSPATPRPAAQPRPATPPAGAPIPPPPVSPPPGALWATPAGAAAPVSAPTVAMSTSGPTWGTSAGAVAAAPTEPDPMTRMLERIGLATDRQAITRADVETWLEGRMLAVVGGIAITLGAAFFLSLAFSRGWITEPMRVLIGLAGGSLAIALGELAFLRLRGIVGHVMVAVGLAGVSLALFAATRLFELVPPEAGVAAALLAAIVAAAIAIRHDSELVAGFGLVSVLASAPLLGAPPTGITILFLATALIGTTAIALFRTWTWLPPIAFLLAAPQVATSLAGASLPQALLTIGGFWLLNTIAAGGEEIRHPSDRPRPSTVTVLLASAAFTLWAGTLVLDGANVGWRGSFVAAVAVSYLAIGLGLLVRYGDRHPFGLIVAATGIASLTLAVPIQFGASWVPVAWAAEGVALCWVAVRYRHPYAAGAALALGLISWLHLVTVEYPPELFAVGLDRLWPFVGPEGLTFAFLLGAAAVAALIVPAAWIRVALGIVAVLTTAYVLPFETSGPTLVVAWSALTVAAMEAWWFAVSTRSAAAYTVRNVASLRLPASAAMFGDLAIGTSRLVRPSFALVVPIPIAAAIAHLMAFEYPIATVGSLVITGLPYVSVEGLTAAAVVAALLMTGWLGSRPALLAGVGAALVVVIYTLPFEVAPPWVMVPWGIVTVAAVAIVRRVAAVDLALPSDMPSVDAFGERLPYLAALFGLSAMVVDALWYGGPSDFLLELTGSRPGPAIPFVDELTIAFVALAATLAGAGWAWGRTRAWVAGVLGAALTIAWLLPFEVRAAYAVAGWSLLAAAGFELIRRLPSTRVEVGAAALGLLGFGVMVALTVVAPPSRLVVDATTVIAGYPALTDASVALLSLAVALAVGVGLHRADRLSLGGAIAAALLLLYCVSVGVVDLFQQQVGSRPLEDLQREAQVALSLLWSVLGVTVFVVGLLARRGLVHRAGLALLGLATAKVFFVDLAFLDVAYRVGSLVGLGVLLLASAVVYARLQGHESPT